MGRSIRILICITLLAAMGPSLPLRSQEDDNTGRDALETELGAIEKRMDGERAELARVLRKQGGLLEKLGALKKQIKRSEGRLARLSAEGEVLAAEAAELLENMDALGERVRAKRALMARRVRARYRFGRLGLAAVLFGAQDVGEMSRRRKYLEALFRRDRTRITEYNALLAEWKDAEAGLGERRERIAALEKLARAEKANLESEKASLAEMLRKVREEKEAREQMLSELTRNAARLSGLIDRLDQESSPPVGPESPSDEPAEPSPKKLPDPDAPRFEPGSPPDDGGGGFASLKGRLCAPAAGPVLSGFGRKVHPEFNTVTMHNGIEIGAEAGAPVGAVAAGTVRFAQWFNGYGNLVIVDHGDGWFTVYAHLAEVSVSVGRQVERGARLGTVGDTGSIDGASLYFEVRHHKQARDPMSWLSGCAL